MNYKLPLLPASILLFFTCCAYPQDPAPAQVNLIPSASMNRPGFVSGKVAKLEMVNVTGQQFTRACRIDVTERPVNQWAVELKLKCSRGISKGDAVMVKFFGRTIAAESETAEGSVSVAVQRSAPNWDKAVILDFSIPVQWTLLAAGAIAGTSLADDTAEITFQLGRCRQILEIANIEVINLGKNVKLESLPFPKLSYDGRDKNAAWRTEAEARIERIRKGDLIVKVTDSDGLALPDAAVIVKMKKHAFPFGTCVNAALLCDTTKTKFSDNDVKRYREWLEKLFNCAVIENHLKPAAWGTQKSAGLEALAWLGNHGFAVRGHTAVWPSERYFAPAWKSLTGNRNLQKYKSKSELIAEVGQDNLQKLDTAVNNHVAEVLGATGKLCVQWDILNEPYTNHTLMDIFGDEVMIKWFKTAKAAAPEVRLFINDYGIVQDEKHAANYIKIIKYLLDRGAPLEGIGEQGHYGQQPAGIPKVLKTFDELGQFNLPLVCTEFDINTRDMELQADYTRDYLTAVFSHPAMQGFLMWGFWDGSHWLQSGGMLRKDWTEKPNLDTYKSLVFKKWWTESEGKTDAAGSFKTRGFLGDYEITVTSGGKSKTVKSSIIQPATTLRVQLE